MSDADSVRYVPIHREEAGSEPVARTRFDLSQLSVTGLVVMCDVDDPPEGNSTPTLSMKITQYLRMSDDSMILLDMDRGVTTFRYGHAEPLSWKRTSADVGSEVLTLIRGDGPDPGSFPWDEYAEAAGLRGITVSAETLRTLPYTVLLSNEVAAIFEF